MDPAAIFDIGPCNMRGSWGQHILRARENLIFNLMKNTKIAPLVYKLLITIYIDLQKDLQINTIQLYRLDDALFKSNKLN